MKIKNMILTFKHKIKDFDDYEDNIIPKYDEFDRAIDEKYIESNVEWQMELKTSECGISDIIFKLSKFIISYNWLVCTKEVPATYDSPNEDEFEWEKYDDVIDLEQNNVEMIIDRSIENVGANITNITYDRNSKKVIVYIN